MTSNTPILDQALAGTSPWALIVASLVFILLVLGIAGLICWAEDRFAKKA